MKRYLLLIAIIYSSRFVFSQIEPVGGEVVIKPADCISDQERDSLLKIANQNAIQLSLNSLAVNSKTSIVTFGWPLEKDTTLADPGYYSISNYVDQNTAATSKGDYNCGSITYDGHKGTDIVTWPFGYDKMNNNLVRVIAAEAGTITYWHDGEFDQNCTSNSNPANAIIVQHVDGSIALYWHMKKNSLTSKGVGSVVAKGEFLGIVGSSGSSTDPHLHFEAYTSASKTKLIDPFAGTCNLLNGTTSWWSSQLPYFDEKLDKIMTGTAIPVIKWGCPANGSVSYEKKTFVPGETVYFSSFYHLERKNGSTTFKVYRPNGTIWQTFSHVASQDYNYTTLWCWNYTLPSNAPSGKWKFEATFNAQVVTCYFNVGITTSIYSTAAGWGISVYPNPAEEELSVSLPDDYKFEGKLGVIDLYGRQILSEKIDVKGSAIKTVYLPADMASGIYAVVLSSKDGEKLTVRNFVKH